MNFYSPYAVWESEREYSFKTDYGIFLSRKLILH